MIRLKNLTTIVFFISSIPALVSAIEISPGDVLIHTSTLENGDGLYLLERAENYTPVKLYKRADVNYDIDRGRNRLYYEGWYLDLAGDTPVLKEIPHFPEGMNISSCAGDGSCLILYREAPDDMYREENPIVMDTGRAYGTILYMLYRYDIATKKLTRLTYSHAQRYSWVTPDGECLAYLRYYEGWRSHFDATVIFCRIDGTAKRDLRFAFEDAGIDMVRIGPEFSFVPKVGYELNGDKYYYVLFRPERRRGDEVEGPVTLDYYYAKLKYEGDELRCEITKKFIEVPEGVGFWNFFSEPSSEQELYFYGSVKGEKGNIIRYDVYEDRFHAIPKTGVFLSFLVY